MRYISICSGIEAATVAWHPLGWKPVAFAEIDAFPSAVLAQHFPTIPNLGDISKIDWRPYRGMVDLIVGGTPCQSFSIAGKREGLEGTSGLIVEYFRLLREVQPRWFVWENVPGALSSNGGKDFESILRAWSECGYHVAWRILDAQYFGVPQRRRRVFAIGHLGDWRYPAQVLFEPDCLHGNTQKSRKTRKDPACVTESRIAKCLISSNQRGDYETETFVPVAFQQNQRGEVRATNVVGTLNTNPDPNGRNSSMIYCAPVAPTIGASGPPYSGTRNERVETEALAVMAYPINTQIATRHNALGKGTGFGVGEPGEPAFTLQANHCHAVASPMACDTYNHTVTDKASSITCKNDGTHSGPSVLELMPRLAVRRLTPTECERLQGFPDGWTDIPWRGKDHAPDGPRYKALGNSMAVPCMRWIGEQIKNVETRLREAT